MKRLRSGSTRLLLGNHTLPRRQQTLGKLETEYEEYLKRECDQEIFENRVSRHVLKQRE